MHTPAITGTGVFTPKQVITNAELVVAFQRLCRPDETPRNAAAIEAGEMETDGPFFGRVHRQGLGHRGSAMCWTRPAFWIRR